MSLLWSEHSPVGRQTERLPSLNTLQPIKTFTADCHVGRLVPPYHGQVTVYYQEIHAGKQSTTLTEAGEWIKPRARIYSVHLGFVLWAASNE